MAETLAFAAVGGGSLGLLGVPAGYLSGSILLVACASIAGRPLQIPVLPMCILMVLIGISLGAVVTPATLRGMANYPLSIAVLLVAMVCVSIAGAAYLRVVHGWGTMTAYLASAPGGLSQVMALAAELGADIRAIAIVQTFRVTVIAVGLPAGLALLGLAGHASRGAGAPFDPAQLGELCILIAAATAVSLIAHSPADELAAVEVHDRGQVQPALTSWNVSGCRQARCGLAPQPRSCGQEGWGRSAGCDGCRSFAPAVAAS